MEGRVFGQVDKWTDDYVLGRGHAADFFTLSTLGG
jgi:hypothetical protein